MKGDSTESGGQSTNPFFDEEDDIGTIHLRRQHFFMGGVVKKLSNLPTDSSKKNAVGRGEGSKSNKICRRLKWMVP